MAPGDVTPVPDGTGVSYLDTGMYDAPEYGAVYLLDAAEPAVIDTGIGADRERVLDALDAVGIGRDGLAHVVLTHVHLDHAGGAGYLAAESPDATVHVHERGARHVVDPGRLIAGTKAAVGEQWRHYAEPRPVPEARVAPLTDGDAIDLGDRRLRARAAPGHAPHQVVYHDDGDDLLFTGDAAGIRSPTADRLFPTSPPPQFDLERCLADLDRLREIDPATLCYAHFGPAPYEPALLDAYERVLTDWVERVRSVRAETGDDAATVEALAADPDPDAVRIWGHEKASAEASLDARGVLGWLDDAGDGDGDA
jgi:glyoxylase-like metal-dependent hydrolase (beta-lactamase superfamily II)